MTRYRVGVHVLPRRGVLDPQGAAVAHALQTLGFDRVHDVRVGKHIVVDADADTADGARDAVRAMCERLLANPVIEDFEIASVAAPPTTTPTTNAAAQGGKP
jgi:phosphoribosylformylglycinamidine synthase subunit PurS